MIESRHHMRRQLTGKVIMCVALATLAVACAPLLAVGLWAREQNAGLHKRMMILATAMTLPAGDRPDFLAADDIAGESARAGPIFVDARVRLDYYPHHPTAADKIGL